MLDKFKMIVYNTNIRVILRLKRGLCDENLSWQSFRRKAY